MNARLRYASYHLHILSALAHVHRAKPTLRDQIALVQALDSALDLLESEPTFQRLAVADGCAVLEDYLRLRPEQLERLESAVQRGAVWINPFYVLPKFFLHTPEAVIRSLLRGTRSAESLGGRMSVVLCLGAEFLPAWLPQVLRGFGLQAILTDWHAAHPLEQLWQGDDGSQVLLAAAHGWLAPDQAIESAYQRAAPYCHSGHLMLPFRLTAPLSANTWRAWFASLQQQRPIDILMHSTPETYIRALRPTADASVWRAGDEAPAEQAFDAFTALERFLTQTLEPLIAFLALQGSPTMLRQPQRLVDQLWQPLFDWQNEPLEDAEQALRAHLGVLASESEALARQGGIDLNAPSLSARLVRADDARFELTACKLPTDPTRDGLVVRGRLEAPEPARIALIPFRRFADCQVVSLAEVPTGGHLAVEADGAFRFRAEPRYLYTFWLHD